MSEPAIEALRKLRNEVLGVLGIAGAPIRATIGNTNMSVLQLRLDEAHSVLEAGEPSSAPPLGMCDEHFDGIRDAVYFHTQTSTCRNWKPEMRGCVSSAPPAAPFPDSVKLLGNLRREILALLPRYRCGDLKGKDVEADFGSMLVRIDTFLEPYDVLGAAQGVSPPSPGKG